MFAGDPDGSNGRALTLVDPETRYRTEDSGERYIICTVAAAALPDDIPGKTISVKGKVGSVTRQSYLDQRRVTLDSCELKK
jgi:hypothetical protein